MRYSEYKAEVLYRIGKDADTGDLDTVMLNNIHFALRKVERAARWKDLHSQYTITTVDGIEDYVLPPDYGRMDYIWHQILGHDYVVPPIPEKMFRQHHMVTTTEGTPYFYRVLENEHIESQLSAASTLKVKFSVDAAANRSVKVRVYGTVGGYPDYEDIVTDSSNATTAVAGSKSFTEIFRVGHSATSTPTGTLIVTDSGDNNLAVLPVGDIFDELIRKFVSFYYIPDTDDESIYVEYFRKSPKMVDDYSLVLLPDDFDQAIVTWAAYLSDQDVDAKKMHYLQYKEEIRDLRANNNLIADRSNKFENSLEISSQAVRSANLGTGYPLLWH